VKINPMQVGKLPYHMVIFRRT